MESIIIILKPGQSMKDYEESINGKKPIVGPKLKEALSKEELYALNKKEQSEIIKNLGKEVPRKEKDRVELILKLQQK